MESFRKIYSSEFHKKFLVHGVRPDGRELGEARNTKISFDSFGSSAGSAFVRISSTSSKALGSSDGDGTAVTCAIVAEVGPPTETTPNGQIIVNVEMTPLCSSRFKTGKPSEEAQALGEFLNSIARSPSYFSLDKLKIDIKRHGETEADDEEDEESSLPPLVWYLYADIYCINYDGSILDASLTALVSAVQNVKLPSLVVTKENQVIALPTDEHSTKIEILNYPIPTSFALVDEYILCDPTLEEEELSGGLVSVVTCSSGGIVALRKSGGASIDNEKLRECIQEAKKRCNLVTMEIKKGR